MRKNTQEKSLIKINENSIFYRIKRFFINLFDENKTTKNISPNKEIINVPVEKEDNKNLFKESIRNIENEETQLLKLQKQYRNGEIKEEELTEEQVNSLCSLYDKQIANLRKSNEIRKHKLLEYRNKHRLQADN